MIRLRKSKNKHFQFIVKERKEQYQTIEIIELQ